jgi:hypothetical protein
MDSGFSGLAKNSQFFVRIGFGLIGFWFSLDGFQMVFQDWFGFLRIWWFFKALVFYRIWIWFGYLLDV